MIHLGDATNKGSLEGIKSFAKWFSQLPHRHKIIIDGNHDRNLLSPEKISLTQELQDQVVDIEGIQILGLTWNTCTRQHYGRIVQYVRHELPSSHAVHLLLTHMPPTMNGRNGSDGLATLAPKLHVKVHLFGHVHRRRGIIGFGDNDDAKSSGHGDGVVRINCSTLPALMLVVVDLDARTGDLGMVYLPDPGLSTKYRQEVYYRSKRPR